MVAVIDGYRKAVLSGSSPDIAGVSIAFSVSALLLVFSYHHFKRLERVFADAI
jgi:ABC-type polysaccharide/polyol phosphate export permease